MNPSGLCMCGCGQPTTLATRTSGRIGLRKGEPVHYVRGHQRMPLERETRRCADCKRDVPVEDYHSRGVDRFGRKRPGAYCKWCATKRRQDSYDANRAEQNASAARRKRGYWQDPEWRAVFNERRRKRSVPEDASAVMVEVAPIRKAVEWSGLGWGEIGARVGIDEGSIRRGLQQEKMNAAKAGKILDAIGVMPAEIGL